MIYKEEPCDVYCAGSGIQEAGDIGDDNPKILNIKELI
jgi:hypothetical protein